MSKDRDGTCSGDLIECPVCGYVDNDSWEWNSGNEGSFEIECGQCDAELTYSRCYSVHYTVKQGHKPEARP